MMEVIKGTKTSLGSCNFHTGDDHYYSVYEFRGDNTTIRICAKCLKKAGRK